MSTKNTILETAIKLFANYGYHKTTMKMIAEKSDISKGTLYWHFSSKKELFMGIIQSRLKKYFSFLEEIKNDSNLTCYQKVKKILEYRIDIFKERPSLFKEITSNQENIDQDFKEKMKKNKQRHIELIEDIFVEGVENGEFEIEDPYILALAFIGMNMSVATEGNLFNEENKKRTTEILMDILFEGILKKDQ